MTRPRLDDPVTLAWIAQYGYLFLGAAFLYVAAQGGPTRDTLILLAQITPFTFMLIFYRCRQCGASVYYHPDSLPWSMFRASLLRPASPTCLKCGTERS